MLMSGNGVGVLDVVEMLCFKGRGWAQYGNTTTTHSSRKVLTRTHTRTDYHNP
jgi:hypothetical protein